MRLQPERMPDAADGRVAEAGCLGHPAGAPMRRAARRAFQRAHNHLLDLLVGDGARRPRPRLVVQAREALPHKPRSPLADRRGRGAQSVGHPLVVLAFGARQHDARAAGQRRDRAGSVGEGFQFASFLPIQRQRGFGASCAHAPSLYRVRRMGTLFASVISVTGY